VMPPRLPPQQRMPGGPGRSVLPPMSRGPGTLPPMAGRTPPPHLRGRPGGRMGKPALNLSQLGLSTKQEQTPFANFSKYV
jgi:mitogen-activated protein kinase kinase